MARTRSGRLARAVAVAAVLVCAAPLPAAAAGAPVASGALHAAVATHRSRDRGRLELSPASGRYVSPSRTRLVITAEVHCHRSSWPSPSPSPSPSESTPTPTLSPAASGSPSASTSATTDSHGATCPAPADLVLVDPNGCAATVASLDHTGTVSLALELADVRWPAHDRCAGDRRPAETGRWLVRLRGGATGDRDTWAAVAFRIRPAMPSGVTVRVPSPGRLLVRWSGEPFPDLVGYRLLLFPGDRAAGRRLTPAEAGCALAPISRATARPACRATLTLPAGRAQPTRVAVEVVTRARTGGWLSASSRPARVGGPEKPTPTSSPSAPGGSVGTPGRLAPPEPSGPGSLPLGLRRLRPLAPRAHLRRHIHPPSIAPQPAPPADPAARAHPHRAGRRLAASTATAVAQLPAAIAAGTVVALLLLLPGVSYLGARLRARGAQRGNPRHAHRSIQQGA